MRRAVQRVAYFLELFPAVTDEDVIASRRGQ